MSQSSTPERLVSQRGRHFRTALLWVVGGVSLLYPFLFAPTPPVQEEETDKRLPGIPDFAVIQDVTVKKKAFFNYLLPEIKRQNQKIMEERHFLLGMAQKLQNGEPLSLRNQARLDTLAEKYKLKSKAEPLVRVETLLVSADIIPPELVLVQAANESAWGTSRFARQGYNFFGLWCFKKGCGFVPSRRTDGAAHEVARFNNLSHAVMTYMRNLNRHAAYREMRKIRQALRDNHQPVSAEAMVQGLMNYSERGQDYIDELLNMIRYNRKYMQI